MSKNYKYLMSRYKTSQLDWNLSFLHVLNKKLCVCNTMRELCQLRNNLYSCDIYIDMTKVISNNNIS